MKTVGITGGIGSGKTTVCRIFELLGVPVFYADDEAKKLYDDKQIAAKVVKLFGKEILSGKKVDKKALAGIVFGHKPSLEKLNAIIHPEVKKRFEAWKKKQQGVPYVMYEAAIMIESGSHRRVDYLVTVNADKELRINRIVKRDKVSAEEVAQRIAKQITDKERAKHADAVIINDGRTSLIGQVLNIHKKILAT